MLEITEAGQQSSTVQINTIFTLKGLELSYKIIESEIEVEKKYMLSRRNMLETIDESAHLFQIYVENEMQKIEYPICVVIR